MVFMPPTQGAEPIWNSDTDEVVHTVNGVAAAGAGIVVVPPQCTYIVISISDTTSGTLAEVMVTPDAADLDSGIVLGDGAGQDRNLGIAVSPGATVYIHTTAIQVDINVTRFYTKK